MERQITKRQNDNANDETENTRVVKKTKTLSSGLFLLVFRITWIDVDIVFQSLCGNVLRFIVCGLKEMIADSNWFINWDNERLPINIVKEYKSFAIVRPSRAPGTQVCVALCYGGDTGNILKSKMTIYRYGKFSTFFI
jgi:hypothetical protein